MEEVKETIVEEEVKVEEVVEEIIQTEEVVVDAEEVELEDSVKKLEQQLEERKAQFEKDEQDHQERMKILWDKEVNLELKLAGLEDFAEFLHFEQGDSDAMHSKVQKFKEIMGKRELSDGYVPNDHRSADKYYLAEKSKDTKTMIGTKLSGLFK